MSRQRVDRRAFLKRSAGTGLALWALGCKREEPRQKAGKSGDPQVAWTVLAAADELSGCARQDVLKVLADGLRIGLTRAQAWQAVDEALQRFEGDVHGRLAVRSLHQLAARLPIRDGLLPLFRAADLLKQEQETKPKPMRPMAKPGELSLADSRALRGKLHEAFAAGDTATMSRALRAMLAEDGQTLVREHLTICAAREDRFAGHGTMYVAQGLRALDQRQWQRPDATLHGIASYLLPPVNGQGPVSAADREAHTEARKASRALDGKLDRTAPGRAASSEDVLPILTAARVMPPGDLAKLTLDRLQGGLGLQAVFAGLTLGAAELALNDDGGAGLGVHALDTINALQSLAHAAPTDRAAALCALMAAHRLPRFRRRAEASPKRPILEKPPAPTATPTTEDALRKLVARGAAPDLHQLKYPVAILEQCAHAPAFARAQLLAAATARMPAEKGPLWPRLQEAEGLIAALRRG